MPKIEHEPHEKFCHFVARGNLPLVAYIGAGYMRNKAAAEALLKQPRIQERIRELQGFYDERYRNKKPTEGVNNTKELRDAEA